MKAKWRCALCPIEGLCEICETCAYHCHADAPNDVEAHRRFDAVIASTDARRRSN